MMQKEAERVAVLERRVIHLEKRLSVLAPRMKKEIIWKKYVEDFLLQKFGFDLRLQVELKSLEEDGVYEVDRFSKDAKNEPQKTAVQNQRIINSQNMAQAKQQSNIPRTSVPPKTQRQSLPSNFTLPSHVLQTNIHAHDTSVAVTRPVMSSRIICENDRQSRDVSITIVPQGPVAEQAQQVTQNTMQVVRNLQPTGLQSAANSMGNSNSQFQNKPMPSTATHYHQSPLVHASASVTKPVTSPTTSSTTCKRPAIQPLHVEVRGHPIPNTASGSKKSRVVGEVCNPQVVQQASNLMQPPAVSMPNPVIVSTSTLSNTNSYTPELIVLDGDDEEQPNASTASSSNSSNNPLSSSAAQQQYQSNPIYADSDSNNKLSSSSSAVQQQYHSNSMYADSGSNVVGSSRDMPFDSLLHQIINGIDASRPRTENADSSMDVLKDFTQLEKAYSDNGYLSRKEDTTINGTPVLDFNVRKILLEFDATHEDIDQITANKVMPASAKKGITNAISDFLMQVYGPSPPRHAKESMADSLFALFPFVPKEIWWYKPQNKNANGSLEHKINNKRRMYQEGQRRLQQLENSHANPAGGQ